MHLMNNEIHVSHYHNDFSGQLNSLRRDDSSKNCCKEIEYIKSSGTLLIAFLMFPP